MKASRYQSSGSYKKVKITKKQGDHDEENDIFTTVAGITTVC